MNIEMKKIVLGEPLDSSAYARDLAIMDHCRELTLLANQVSVYKANRLNERVEALLEAKRREKADLLILLMQEFDVRPGVIPDIVKERLCKFQEKSGGVRS